MALSRDKIKLVIFDCDGVLVDSERITNTVFCEMLRELGQDVDLQYMFDHFVGNSMARRLEIIESMSGTKPPKISYQNLNKERKPPYLKS